jgi:glycosyltransferase involved in cell wall biosynthesis
MKPLRVALCTKAISPVRFERDGRNVGIFSYAVPEFEWEHVAVHKWQDIDTRALAEQGFDLAFHEDGAWAHYPDRALPVVYYVVDSTLSEDHYRERLEQAQDADLVLVDHDRLERFAAAEKPLRQLPHCVNDRVFRDRGLERTADVASHMNVGGPCGDGRLEVGTRLEAWCGAMGYTYRGGTMGVEEYARSFNAARVSVNWPRTPINRSHRVLDAMACRTCLVTGAVPDVPGEERVAGRDCVPVDSYEEFFLAISELLESGAWREIADSGWRCVREHHTWSVRARQLRQILHEELGL